MMPRNLTRNLPAFFGAVDPRDRHDQVVDGAERIENWVHVDVRSNLPSIAPLQAGFLRSEGTHPTLRNDVRHGVAGGNVDIVGPRLRRQFCALVAQNAAQKTVHKQHAPVTTTNSEADGGEIEGALENIPCKMSRRVLR